MSQKNVILLGGPWHGKMVPFAGECFLVRTKSRRIDGYFCVHKYLWEYRGGYGSWTVFGVYQLPK